MDIPETSYVTSEKQAPSVLDMLGAVGQAVALERKNATSSQSKALKDLLTKCIGDYNRLTTRRSHRVDTQKKQLIYNMSLWPNSFCFCSSWVPNLIGGKSCSQLRLRSPPDLGHILHSHYDSFKHEQSG